MERSSKYLLIAIATFIFGYLFLRFSYFTSGKDPFAQEIVLIVLGTLVTIAITAALLNKQSEVEIEKEQRVKIFDLRAKLYFELIEFVENILVKNTIDETDLLKLEFLTHKISIIASENVLHSYSGLIETIKETSLDSQISALESDELSTKLANLCGKIRYDLILKENKLSNVQKIINNNIAKLTDMHNEQKDQISR
jgi:hypothetical protein